MRNIFKHNSITKFTTTTTTTTTTTATATATATAATGPPSATTASAKTMYLAFVINIIPTI